MVTGRLPLVANDSDDPVLAPVFDRFRDAGREVPVLYRTLGNAPAMLKAWVDMAWPLRSEPETDRGLRELLIMRVAQLTQAGFEWVAHWDMAVHHGVSTEQLEALAGWRESDLFTDEERAALAVTDELTTGVEASAAAMDELARHFEPGPIVELVLTAAFYNCVSRTLRSLGLEPDPGDERLAVMRSGTTAASGERSSGAPSS